MKIEQSCKKTEILEPKPVETYASYLGKIYRDRASGHIITYVKRGTNVDRVDLTTNLISGAGSITRSYPGIHSENYIECVNARLVLE